MSAEGDRAIIDRLTELGADLSEAREVEHFLLFDDREAAEAAAADLEGYDTTVLEPDADGDRWALAAVKTLAVSVESIAAERDRMSSVAQHHGGEYDGWGAEA
jgi:regulator of RNase E activity RraB